MRPLEVLRIFLPAALCRAVAVAAEPISLPAELAELAQAHLAQAAVLAVLAVLATTLALAPEVVAVLVVILAQAVWVKRLLARRLQTALEAAVEAAAVKQAAAVLDFLEKAPAVLVTAITLVAAQVLLEPQDQMPAETWVQLVVPTAAVVVAVKTEAALALLAALVLLVLFGFFGALAAPILQLTQETYKNALATTY